MLPSPLTPSSTTKLGKVNFHSFHDSFVHKMAFASVVNFCHFSEFLWISGNFVIVIYCDFANMTFCDYCDCSEFGDLRFWRFW